MRLRNPTVLVTRPTLDAQRFVDRLKQVAGPFTAVISPAFGYEQLDVDMPAFDTAVFTSKSGVIFAPAGQGRLAYCVGEATARAARTAGYEAISADGAADDLVSLILKEAPSDTLAHLRGVVSRGEIGVRLRAAGLPCADVVIYRKERMMPTEAAKRLVGIEQPILIPVFSAETVAILTQWPISLSGHAVVAISEAVARDAKALGPAALTVSKAPNMDSMALATARMIA